ncbi:MAG: VWA domain-containing protein [Oscillospiraceae bacterium]|nr:VWA domain-containing protein [Oscillospiraceae bacterium]
MHKKDSKSKRLIKPAYLFLTIIMLLSVATPFITSLASTLFYSIDYAGREADPDTSAPANMGFLDIPKLHDGRIWTDKSVNVNTAPGADDFIVTLSALSQSFSLYDGYVIPTDTVFIIDVSGSMYMESIAGRPRIAVLVEALNEAVGILLDANAQNRIAVAAYGGRTGGFSRAEYVIPLGRPELIQGAADFFTYRPGSPNNYVDVNTTNRNTTSVLVQGSTPTQRGILYGSSILENADELTIPALTPTGEPFTDPAGTQFMVTRKPNFILMTDGEPTMAWSDYLFTADPTDTNQTHGDGSNGETGVSLLTVLTAAHRKRLVYQRYYGSNPLHDPTVLNYSGLNDEPVGFYTISLNDVPAPLLISATMLPFDQANVSADGNADLAYPDANGDTIAGPYPSGPPLNAPIISMGEQLRDFITSGTLSFFAQFRLVYPNYIWQDATINNSEALTLDELAFADAFFPANDLQTLRDAFASIAIDLQRESYSGATSSEPGEEEFDGYLVFSDVLGEYMEFKGITGFEFDNTAFNRNGFAEAIINNTGGARTRYEDILYRHMNYGNMPGVHEYDSIRYIQKERVSALIESNIASGSLAANNCIRYYAYGNRDFAGSFYNTDGSPATIPERGVAEVKVYPMWGTLNTAVHTGGATDLMYITFHVVTALENNTLFEEIFNNDPAGNPLNRTLRKGDQMVRWYIPAVLIPQRKVDRDTGSVTGNKLPVRVNYKVGLSDEMVKTGVSDSYRALHKKSGNNVYFYTNQYLMNVSMSFFQPHMLNPFYQTGRPGMNEREVAKASNPTETAPHVTLNRFAYIPGEGRTDMQQLGNNGRLTAELIEIERAPQTGTINRSSLYIYMFYASLVFIGIAALGFIGERYIFNKKNRKKRDKK